MIEEGLRTYLLTITEVAALSGAKVYCERSPQSIGGSTHVVTERIDGEFNNSLDGTGGLRFAEFDIDCKATSLSAAGALADAIEAAIDDYTGSMGDETCEAVLMLDRANRNEPYDDNSDNFRSVVTLTLQLQYT